MENLLEELSKFEGREEGLRKVTRYSLYHTMWYRTNLWTHSRRVAWLVQEMIPTAKEVFGNSFDEEKACLLALVHDDAEMIIGDIQAGNKEKMSKEVLNDLDSLEIKAADNLSARFPKYIGKYEYKELLYEAVHKKSIEYTIVDWADKFDGFCEALHELFAGHELWTKNVVNEYGTILLPTDHYMNYFNKFSDKFSAGISLLEKDNLILKIPKHPNPSEIVVGRKFHTVDSLKNKTRYLPYDLWMSINLNNGNEEDIRNLYIKKE